MKRADYTEYARNSARALEDLRRLIRESNGSIELVELYRRLDDSIAALFDTASELAASEERLRRQGATLLAARMQAELERHHYRQLFDGSPDAYIVTDANGMIREGNLAASVLLKVSPLYLVKKPLVTFVAIPKRSEFRHLINAFRQGDHPEIYEWEFTPRHGDPVEVSVTVASDRDEFGNLLALRWLVRDISAQVISRERFERLSRRNELLLSSVGEGIFGVNIKGVTTFINPAGARMLGWPEQEFIGRTVDEVLGLPPDEGGIVDTLARSRTTLVEGTVRTSEEETFRHRDGSRIPVDYTSTPIIENGEIAGMVVAFRDITMRLESKRRIDLMNQELEIRVAERTADLERVNRELQKVNRQKDILLQREQAARADAEHANRVKDDFMAIVSHELRTPLTTIKTFTDLMLRNPVDESETREYLSVISAECDRQISLVQNVLDVAFIESRDFSLSIERVDLEELVATCLPPHIRSAEAANQTIEIDIPSGLGPVRGDSFALRRIVSNLLENAVKYTPPGGRITVSATEGMRSLRLHVRDTGHGIAEEDLSKIFEKYYRGCDSGGMQQVETTHGVGLGLYLARLFTERVGGQISVISQPGEGSTFSLRLARWGMGGDSENNIEETSDERTPAGR